VWLKGETLLRHQHEQLHLTIFWSAERDRRAVLVLQADVPVDRAHRALQVVPSDQA
jgi:hypothetical protein